MKQIRNRFTYANVMSSIAVFLVLGGGAAFAASQLPKNSVGPKQIKRNAVTAAKIKNGAVTTAKIKDNAVTGAKVNEATLGVVPSAANAANATNATTATNSDKLGGTAAVHYVTPSSTLAAGDTAVGTFAASAPSGSFAIADIELKPKAPSAPDNSHVIRIPLGDEVNAQCPGPRQAAAGYLCIYEAWRWDMSFSNFHSPFSDSGSFGSAAEGVVLYYTSSGPQGNVRGNWAYTAG